MKFFSLSFIICLLFSVWQPCQNLLAADISYSPAAEKIKVYNDSESNESEDCSEVCSGCESVEADMNLTFSVSNKFKVRNEKTFEDSYQNQYSQNHLNLIWQPPKINFTA